MGRIGDARRRPPCLRGAGREICPAPHHLRSAARARRRPQPAPSRRPGASGPNSSRRGLEVGLLTSAHQLIVEGQLIVAGLSAQLLVELLEPI